MARFLVLVLIFVLCTPGSAYTQSLSLADKERLRSTIYRLKVDGVNPLGGSWAGSNGVAVLFYNPEAGANQLLTARHVVGKQDEFKEIGDDPRPDRKIKIYFLGDHGGEQIQRIYHLDSPHQIHDVTKIYISARKREAAILSDKKIKIGQKLHLFTWISDEYEPKYHGEVSVIHGDPGVDGDRIRLDVQSFRGQSGSPLFDDKGELVAILNAKYDPRNQRSYSLAVPASEFTKNYISTTLLPELKKEVAQQNTSVDNKIQKYTGIISQNPKLTEAAKQSVLLYYDGRLRVNSSLLDVRESPNGEVIATLPRGHIVDVARKSGKQEWVIISTEFDAKKIEGFVPSGLLRGDVGIAKERLVLEAVRMWLLFDKGNGQEHQVPYLRYVGDMWSLLGLNYDGADKGFPWSAAFNTYVFQQSGYTGVKPSASHSKYVHQAIRRRLENEPGAFWGYRIDEYRPQIGDLVVRSRRDKVTFDQASKNSYWQGNASIIVEVSKNYVKTIGGNVKNSVSEREYSLNSEGFLTGDQNVFAILHNNF